MLEVTWKCHQTLMHSLSSHLSKIKLTVARIMLRQCTEGTLLLFLISCQGRISCCEVQSVFGCTWLIFPAFLYIYSKGKVQICDFLCCITLSLNISHFVHLALLSGTNSTQAPILLSRTVWLTFGVFFGFGPLYSFLNSYCLYLSFPKSKSLDCP